MLAIPFYIILFLYLIFLCVFFIFSLINFYHIISTGSLNFTSFVVTFLITALSILTLYYTWEVISTVDWSRDLVLFDINWFKK
ncbi:MAG: hypothetical protein ACD_18C00065G0003 [uncultured bacterium]|nr:MAG: hypothetical protein ACD_18C00065G0003 [uncultured bacterium]